MKNGIAISYCYCTKNNFFQRLDLDEHAKKLYFSRIKEKHLVSQRQEIDN